MKQFLICLALLCLITNVSFSQTKIRSAEKSLNSGKTSSDDDDDYSDDGDLFEEVFGEIIGEAFLYLTYYTFIESPTEGGQPMSYAPLTKYPYNNSIKGNYTYGLDDDYSNFRTEFTGRYITESSSLKGMHLNLEMRFAKRMGLEFDYQQLWEKNAYLGNDQLALYNLFVKYYRVRTEKIDLWWGIGGSYVDGDVDRFGFTYGLGFELFFAKPLSAEINFNQTFINSETINKFNVLLNYHIDQYKIIGGYEHLKIGTQRFSMATLGIGVFF